MSFTHMHKGVPCGERACALEPDSADAVQAVAAGLTYDAVEKCAGKYNHAGHVWNVFDPEANKLSRVNPEGRRYCLGHRNEALAAGFARLAELGQQAAILAVPALPAVVAPGERAAWLAEMAAGVEARGSRERSLTEMEEQYAAERRAAVAGEEERARRHWREGSAQSGECCVVCGLFGPHTHGTHQWIDHEAAGGAWCAFCGNAKSKWGEVPTCPARLQTWPTGTGKRGVV